MRLLTTITVIFVFVISCSRSHADDSIPYYSVESPSSKLFVSYGQESEQRSGPFSNSTKDTATTREKFEFRTKGWIYHPAFLIFTAALLPEFKQQNVDSRGTAVQEQENDATFLGYFLDTTLLQYKPYAVSLFVNKTRSDYASSLAADSVTESSTYRGQLSLNYQPVPTIITFESKDQVSESFFLTKEASEKFRIDSKHNTSRSKTRLEAEFFEQNRNVRGSDLYGERNFVYLSNQYKLGGKSNLSSGLRFSDNTSGAINSKTTFFSSQLVVRHRKKLRSNYHIRLDDRDEGGFIYKKQYGAAELTHQLYDNLTTTLSGDIDMNEYMEGTLNTYSAGYDFRYARKIPWGDLNINLGYRERVDDDQRTLAYAEVRDEFHVLTGTDLVLLENNVIDVSSIVVTDISGLPYAINTDYIVTVVDTSVFISRNTAGGISVGEEILVDYRYEAEPPAKIATATEAFGINLNLWSKFRLYYYNNRTNEEFISGTEPSELTHNTIQRVGIELRWNWSLTSVEIEDRDTTRTPTKRFKLSEVLSFTPSRYMSYGLAAEYSKLDFIDTNEQTETNGYSIYFQRDFGRAGQLSANGYIEELTGSVQQSDKKGLNVLHQWRYGGWQPSIRYVFSDEIDNLVGETRKRNNLYFEVSRKFQ